MVAVKEFTALLISRAQQRFPQGRPAEPGLSLKPRLPQLLPLDQTDRLRASPQILPGAHRFGGGSRSYPFRSLLDKRHSPERLWPPLKCYRFRKTDDRELARSVNRLSTDDRSEAGDGSVVHDCAGPGPENGRDLMFQAREGRPEKNYP
jgi:hypothetical protein